jgi:hypothetical protein
LIGRITIAALARLSVFIGFDVTPQRARLIDALRDAGDVALRPA